MSRQRSARAEAPRARRSRCLHLLVARPPAHQKGCCRAFDRRPALGGADEGRSGCWPATKVDARRLSVVPPPAPSPSPAGRPHTLAASTPQLSPPRSKTMSNSPPSSSHAPTSPSSFRSAKTQAPAVASGSRPRRPSPLRQTYLPDAARLSTAPFRAGDESAAFKSLRLLGPMWGWRAVSPRNEALLSGSVRLAFPPGGGPLGSRCCSCPQALRTLCRPQAHVRRHGQNFGQTGRQLLLRRGHFRL